MKQKIGTKNPASDQIISKLESSERCRNCFKSLFVLKLKQFIIIHNCVLGLNEEKTEKDLNTEHFGPILERFTSSLNVMVPLTWTMPICSLWREGWLRTRSPALSLATNLRTWEKQRDRERDCKTDEKLAGSCSQRVKVSQHENRREQNPHILSDEGNVSPHNEVWETQQKKAWKTLDFAQLCCLFPSSIHSKETHGEEI